MLFRSFYKRRTRTSAFRLSMEDRTNKTSMAINHNETRDGMSTFQINPATPSASRGGAGDITSPRTLYSHPDSRLSSWLIPETEQTPAIQGTPMTTMDRLTSYITRSSPARQDQEQSRLWTYMDVESGTPPVDARTGFAVTPPASQEPQRITMTFDAPYSDIRNSAVSLRGTMASFDAVENYSKDDFTPPKVPKLPGSPVYGLSGIIRYHGESSFLSRPSSVQSSGMESLLRQQAELDQSVAELRLFSPNSVTSGDRETVPGGQSSSIRSGFSLSIFPDPPQPPTLPHQLDDDAISDVSRASVSDGRRAHRSMLPVSSTADPRIPPSSMQLGQYQSFAPSSVRSSTDATVLGGANRTILGSEGYDVTSFIGS